ASAVRVVGRVRRGQTAVPNATPLHRLATVGRIHHAHGWSRLAMIADLAARARSVPILSELARRGIKLRRSGAEWIGPCPRCGGRDRFSVNPAKAIFHCRRSGAGGDVIDLVQYLDEVDFVSAGQMFIEGVAPAHAVSPADAGAERRQLAHDWAHQRALN